MEGQGALMLAATAATVGVAGCEYADDVGPKSTGPAVVSPTAGALLPTRDPELVAAVARNQVTLEDALGKLPDGMLFAGSGGIGDPGSGGFSTSGLVTEARAYSVTAACAGAPDAHLSVIQGARQGGTLLERSIDCGAAAESRVELVPGRVSAHLIRYGGGPRPGPWGASGSARAGPGSRCRAGVSRAGRRTLAPGDRRA